MMSKIKRWVILLSFYLVPGMLIATFYYILSPILSTYDFPSAFTLSMAVVFVLIPVQFGYLVLKKDHTTKQSLLRSIIEKQEKVSLKIFILYVIGLIIFSGLVFALFSNTINPFLKDDIFGWIPSWARTLKVETREPIQTITILSLLIFANILGPLVEELYFRGYLLNKIHGSITKKSLINSFLFSVYHFWSPWDFLARTIAVFPYGYITLKTKNVWIAVLAHISVNTLSSIPIMLLLF